MKSDLFLFDFLQFYKLTPNKFFSVTFCLWLKFVPCFHTCTQIFGFHKAPIHVLRYSSALCQLKTFYAYFSLNYNATLTFSKVSSCVILLVKDICVATSALLHFLAEEDLITGDMPETLIV